MRILLVSPFLPYPAVPHAGGKFIYMILEFLSRNHEVDLVTRVFPADRRHEGEARQLARRFFPVMEGESSSPYGGRLRARIASYRRLAAETERVVAAGRYDAVLVEYTESGIFLKCRDWPPAALDCHDIITKPWDRRSKNADGLVQRIALRAAFHGLSLAERRTVGKFRIVFVRSPYDAELARRWFLHPDVRVLAHPAGAGFSIGERREVPGRILFFGAMNRQLNVDAALFFAEKVLPVVLKTHPHATFRIAGGNPPPRLHELAAQNPAVTVTGFVEDIGEEYGAASVFVAPILVGGGIIVKILDAMAAGVPVVTTAYGNEGIGATDGKDLLIADGPESFAEKVNALLADEALHRLIAENGRGFARANFSEPLVMEALNRSLTELAAAPGGAAVRHGL